MLGYSNYRLRTFSPQELGIDLAASHTRLKQIRRVFFFDGILRFIARIFTGPLENNFVLLPNERYTIEKRQRYVWLLGIPFFPAGTYWCVRLDESGEQFEIPAEQLPVVRAIPRRFIFPWRSLLVLYVAVIGIGGFFAVESVFRKLRHDSADREQARKAQAILRQLHHPLRGQLYEFNIWVNRKQGLDFNGEIYLRVDSAAGTRTTFSAVTKNFSSWDYDSPFQEDEWRQYFRDSAILGTYTVDQSVLSEIVQQKYYDASEDAKIIPAIDPGGYLVLRRILKPEN